ncbi:hypothetical protein [Thiomicrospira microaerophila]|uniref:hypothetical protein n=1 Tax=Thiomicrospira microaerophila TaxID=406020 RepID=UPI0005C813A4|nr:hypothetical protein [Thiomicrospira microaerophila]
MSEPITPKADQHVVEGEFIEADKVDKAAQLDAADTLADSNVKSASKKATASSPAKANHNRLLLTLVIMLVSGGALATALVTWLQLQPVLQTLSNQQAATVMVPNEQADKLARVIEKIAYQQNHIQQMGQALQAQQAQTQQFEQQFAAMDAQFSEMQHRLIALGEELEQLAALETQADAQVLIRSEAPDQAEQTPAAPTVIQIQDPNLRRDLNQLRSQLETALEQLNQDLGQLNQQSQQALTQLNDYVLSQKWQQDKARLQSQVETLTQQLSELTAQQQDWIEQIKPQIEQTLEEVAPQLDGFLSIFNQLFSIKKHGEAEQ